MSGREGDLPASASQAAGAALPRRCVLAIDTATTRAVVVLGDLDGTVRAAAAWDAGHRHGEELLARIAGLFEEAGIGQPAREALAGVVVGTGPGGFTGLRVGLATARGIARAAGARLVGVATGAALEAAGRAAGGVPGGAPLAVVLPAGPGGCYVVRGGEATLAPAGWPDLPGWRAGTPAGSDETLVAVDLAGRAPAEASRRGAAALAGLGGSLLALGAARLRAGVDEGADVGPVYVSMPRGVARVAGEVTWSPARP